MELAFKNEILVEKVIFFSKLYNIQNSINHLLFLLSEIGMESKTGIKKFFPQYGFFLRMTRKAIKKGRGSISPAQILFGNRLKSDINLMLQYIIESFPFPNQMGFAIKQEYLCRS
ncbi:hypothetical protein CLV48_1177 [Cecembia rubra]|uniref:Uncharacterized protein n=1 Tax=Cecembia rubra TaxID=1485585 RepID=A0A2P8DPU6_9BACT|nr:hypothetical protein CLV48_1177 [Cecembia rubra]